MKKNEGAIDRVFRIIVGVVLVAAGFSTVGRAAVILWIVGGILLITGITGFCGIYALFGMDTCKKKD